MGVNDPSEVSKKEADKSVYNLYVSSGNQYDNLVHTNWLLDNYPNLETIYMQIDWPESYGPFDKSYLQYRHHPDISGVTNINFIMDYLMFLSLPALDFKYKNNFIKQGEYIVDYKNGNYYYPIKDRSLALNCNHYTATVSDFTQNRVENKFSHEQNKLNQLSLTAIEKIVKKATERKVAIKVFITPYNHKFLDTINLEQYSDFIYKLSKITEFWNFAFYSDITNNNCNYYETSHYAPNLTNRLFTFLKSPVDNDRNVRYINQQNVADQLKYINTNFVQFRSNH